MNSLLKKKLSEKVGLLNIRPKEVERTKIYLKGMVLWRIWPKRGSTNANLMQKKGGANHKLSKMNETNEYVTKKKLIFCPKRANMM